MAKKKRRPKPPVKKTNLNLLYVAGAVIVLAVLAAYLLSGTEKPEDNLPDNIRNLVIPLTNKQSTYEPGKVKMIEFLKFNCGHCYSLHKELPGLKQKYGEPFEVTYVPMLWRTVRGDAGLKKSIEAYILAEKAGKGEEMRDALFRAQFEEGRDLTSVIVLEEIGRSVGLGDDFATALKNGDAADEAEDNITLAENYEVDATPTIIINGNLKVKNPSKEDLDTIIGSLLS